MSYYEFIFTGKLTPEYEKKTNELIENINKHYVPYVIHKISDEENEEDEQKTRTIIINSHTNITSQLSYYFINCGLNMSVYWKQQII